MSSTSKDRDRERDRAPSPPMPTPTEIRASLQRKEKHLDARLRVWMSQNLFPHLRESKNYEMADGVVSMKHDFYILRAYGTEKVESLVRFELERKMPDFKIEKLVVVYGGKSSHNYLCLHLLGNPDAAAISDDTEKKITNASAPPRKR